MSEHRPLRRVFLTRTVAATAALPGIRDVLALRPPGSDPFPTPEPLPAPDPSPAPSPGPPPNPSPAVPGPYSVGKVILGECDIVAADALPQYFTLNGYPGFPNYFLALGNHCADGTLVGPQLAQKILAAVYYPQSYPGTQYNKLGITPGRFPVMLYAHGYRDPLGTACGGAHPSTRDFAGNDAMLRHVASYGCIVVVPDLSWIPGGFAKDSSDYYQYGIALRADVLFAYFQRLTALNVPLFAQRLDLSRLVMAGHSTGGPAAVEAGRWLRGYAAFQSLSFGLLAPIPGVLYGAHSNLVVLGGTVDTLQGANPVAAYVGGGPPKSLVTIPGANHFGYTDLCPSNNHAADVGLYDQNAVIPRDAQQLVGAAYLAALVRYYATGDQTARPYLNGTKQIEELASAGVPGIQVISQGFA
jgi:hypothetical protein